MVYNIKPDTHVLRLQNEHSILKTLYHGFIKRRKQPCTNPPKRSRIEAEEEQMHRTDRRTGSYGFAGRYPAINFIKRKTVF